MVDNLEELLHLTKAAFLGTSTGECDICNRYPDSPSDGVKLCSLCRLGEFLLDDDLTLVHRTLADHGLADATTYGAEGVSLLHPGS
jgi:hypothetical protein